MQRITNGWHEIAWDSYPAEPRLHLCKAGSFINRVVVYFACIMRKVRAAYYSYAAGFRVRSMILLIKRFLKVE